MITIFLISVFAVQVFAAEQKFDPTDVRVKVFAQGKDWLPAVHENEIAGTTGESRPLEALSISVYDGTQIEYRVYISGKGWTEWVAGGKTVGVPKSGKAITGLELRTLSDNLNYKIVYRAHVANAGWMPWTEENGDTVGDCINRVEAIRIKRVPVDSMGTASDW